MGILALFVALGCHFWTVSRIGGWNQLAAFGVFFCWPAGVIPLIVLWGDEEHDIRVPFFCTLGFAILAILLLRSGKTGEDAALLPLQWLA